MESQRVDKLHAILEEISQIVDEEVAIKLELDKCNQILQKLERFSSECVECDQYLVEFERHILQLNRQLDQLTSEDIKDHKQKMNHIRSHLIQQHELIRSGFYLSIHVSLGICLGFVFGLFLLHDIERGLAIGVGLGVAVGMWLETASKNKGHIL
ncbi:hypothetical protein [Gracilibacillus alcaliphilus]|uniref:hypothetical protein n=1 Tax=Gracilibacillus alcaliphilus TaxID=1401441 RepID=UPI00195C04EA|nr:hypothetical protein [Gracilibacillus alcaliphilus]MBM7676195.1 putative membrane protein YccC [Gracilibacillus alcaliphilus]